MRGDVLLVGEVLLQGEWRFAAVFPDKTVAAHWLSAAKKAGERRTREFVATGAPVYAVAKPKKEDRDERE